MHNNYYFLRQLAPALTHQLAGYKVVTCFSQEKDELVIGLTNGTAEFWLRAQLSATFTVLALPETFHRARANSVDLLPNLLGQEVAEVSPLPHDRVLQVRFRSNATLLLKLYGPRPNAIFRVTDDAPPELFHQRYIADAAILPLPNLTFNASTSESTPETLPAGGEANPLKRYPALADLPARYLRAHGYDPAPLATKLQLVREVIEQLEHPDAFFITVVEGRTRLSLLQVGEVERSLPPDPIAALRLLVPLTLSRRAHETELRQVRQVLERRADEAATSASMARTRLHALEYTAGYRQTADLLMAHLSEIPVGAASVEVVDFYQNDQVRTIKLKPTETPQRTAQNLYRKAKNQH